MSQKFPNIGLRAVLDLTGYTPAARKYISLTRDIDRATQQTANRINQSSRGLTNNIARSFEEFARKSSIIQDAFDNLRPDAAIAEYQRLGVAFQDLGDKGQVNVALFDRLSNAGVGFADAMRIAGGQVQFNADLFDQLIQRGVDVDVALRHAAGGADQAGQTIAILGQQFTTAAVAIGAVTTALTVTVRVVQQSITEYNELSEATRRLRYETGLLSAEASGWVQVAQASGVSANTASRAMSMFLSRAADLRREQTLGEESTSDFAKALDFLDVSISDTDGNLKDTEQLLNEVNVAFQNLGPGIQTAGAAQDLFGRTGRQLLPILTDQSQALTDYQATLDRFGARLSALDQKEYEEFLQSQFELRAALQGVANTIASNWIPVLGGAADVLSEGIGLYNLLVRELLGVDFTVQSVANALNKLADALATVNRVTSRTITFWKGIAAQVNPLIGLYARLAEEEEKAAQARALVAQGAAAAAEAERERQRAIQETLQQLSEIQAEYADKLADIEADAADKWNDILVTRQREAIDRARQEAFRLIDLKAAYDQQLADIERDAARRWENILVNRQRDAIERGIRLAQRYEDLARSAEQSRQDAIRAAAERGAELRRDALRRVEDAERDSQRRREELERDHQRRLRDIQLQFLDTAREAARRNDAVAVARAQRQRAQELRDEQNRYTDEQRDLQEALRQKREDIARDRQEREEQQRQELERALQRIEENYARQREALVRQNQRERELRELRYRWELEDFEKAKAEQRQAAQEAYERQLEDFRLAKAREQLERDIAYQREEADFNAARQKQLDDAIAWYEKERDALAAHLNLTGQQLEAVYAEWAIAAGEAAAAVARAASDALASEITRYQHLLTEAERARAQAYVTPGGGGYTTPLQTRRNAQGVYVPIVPGAPVLSQAEGGVVHASSPTNVVMGDAGPETAVFLPGGSRSLNVNHNFGRMGVDFNGLPGGMNTSQIQSIVYQVIAQVAKGVQVPRS